jgi:hypothetical protein
VKEQVISVTVAARMFADCVNRVRYQGISFLLKKNGVSVARIVPVDPVSGLNLEDVIATPAPPLHLASDSAKEPSQPADKLSAEAENPETKNLPQKPMLNW